MRFHLLFAVSSLLITVFSVTVADAEQLLSEKFNTSGEVKSKVHSSSEVQTSKTSAKYLLRTPRNQNFVPQLSQATTDVVSVTDVKVNTTDKGIELILITANSVKLQVSPKTEGNSYIADIPNAQLKLASGDFRQQKPYSGIALITVTNVDANTLRVTVVGETSTPVVELFDSQTEGLVFGVTPAVSTAIQPTTPLQQNQTQQKQPPIELEVTAPPDTYRVPNTSIGTKTDTPLRDIPQSIQVIPGQVWQDQSSDNLGDVLRNAGVAPPARFPGRFADEFTIRGFSNSFTNIFINGLRQSPAFSIIAPTDLTNLQRVEVFKGPASVLYGRGNLSGFANLVTKQPLAEPYYNLQFTAGSYSYYRPSIDLSGPLTSDKNVLYRFNASYINSDSFLDFYNQERYLVAPVITARLGNNTKLTLEGSYTQIKKPQEIGLPARGTILPNPNGELPISRFLGEPSNPPEDRAVTQGSYRLEHRFNENWSLQNAFQITLLRQNVPSVQLSALLADDQTATRTRVFDNINIRNNYISDTNVTGKFKTGSIQHQILVGFELSRYVQPLSKFTRVTAPSINIFNPIYDQTGGGTLVSRSNIKTKIDSLGFYAQDQISFLDNLKLVLGGRWDFTDFSQTNRLISTTTNQDDSVFSPRVGLVYQPSKALSLYASYSRSFEPVVGTAADGSAFKPQYGTQYEAGAKTDLFDGKLSATLALYQFTLSNVTTTDLTNQDFSIQIGEQTSRGVELNLAGEILPGWNVITAYSYTDARITQDNNFPVGNLLPNQPVHLASLWTTYFIPKGDLQGLGFGFGLTYVGDQQVDSLNTLKLPSYIRADAALYYRRNNFNAALNIQNLFDKRYFEASNGDTQVFPALPLIAKFTLGWQF
ncbi:TonB-dependent siderophore receptor [Nostoc sp.]|uniref:TonB-dependent siderophore receptor n=1 Tax=Nostoc sp. TaxID=1180 RepID=UPI002FF594B1